MSSPSQEVFLEEKSQQQEEVKFEVEEVEEDFSNLKAMPFFVAPMMGFGMGGFLPTLILVGGLAYVAANLLPASNVDVEERDADRIAVARVQVGLLGQAREIQRDLDDIARKADTENRKGLHTVLVEAALALMRNPQYLAYGYSDCVSARTPSLAEGRFNELSLEERAKFEAETLSNVGGMSRTGTLKDGPNEENTEYILVTILLAYDGAFKLPKVTDAASANDALQMLGRTQASRVNAVEILWAPQAAGDVMTADELLEKYPNLVPL